MPYISSIWEEISDVESQSPYILMILCSQSEISLVLLGSISGSNSLFLSLGTDISMCPSQVRTCFLL